MLIVLTALLSIVDVIMTNVILIAGGVERNPITKWFMATLDNLWWIPKLSITAVVLLALWWLEIELGVIAFFIVQLAVVLWNVHVYMKIRKERR